MNLEPAPEVRARWAEIPSNELLPKESIVEYHNISVVVIYYEKCKKLPCVQPARQFFKASGKTCRSEGS